MKKPTISYAEKLDDIRLMIECVDNHIPALDSIGLTADYLKRLKEAKLKVEKTKHRREHLEAQKRVATAQLQEQMQTLDNLYIWGRKTIKNNFPQAHWIGFGIDAKH